MTADRGLLIDWEDGNGWTDETPYLQNWTANRGSAPEIIGSATAGGGVVALDNTTGRFSPKNTGGDLYGFLEDGPKVWLGIKTDGTFEAGGTVRGVLAGRISDLSTIPAAGRGIAPRCEIVVEDALARYARTEVLIPDSISRNQKTLREAILAAIPETRTDLALESAPLPLSSASGDAMSLLGGINQTNGTRHYIRPADNPTDWYDYVTVGRMEHLNGVADSSISDVTNNITSIDGWRVSGDTVVNQQRATVTPISFAPVEGTVFTAEVLPIKVTSAAPVTLWANFQDYVSDPRLVETHTGDITAVFTPLGATAKIEFTSASSGTVKSFSVLGYIVVRGAQIVVQEDDLVSQAKPRGRRNGPDIVGDFVGVEASARGIAAHMVYRYGTPKLRPTLTAVNWFPGAFDRDLYEILAVTSGQVDAAGFLMEIVGLTHTGSYGSTASGGRIVSHQIEYTLQESREQSPKAWFTWDVDKWDTGPGVLGY